MAVTSAFFNDTICSFSMQEYKVTEETAAHTEYPISPKLSLTYTLHVDQTLQPVLNISYTTGLAALF